MISSFSPWRCSPNSVSLLFERFLSWSRGEWPDIDLDLPSEDKRDQAIQYVYQLYGELGAAMTANVIIAVSQFIFAATVRSEDGGEPGLCIGRNLKHNSYDEEGSDLPSSSPSSVWSSLALPLLPKPSQWAGVHYSKRQFY